MTPAVAKPQILLKPEDHSYWRGDQRLECLSVTGVLAENGLISDYGFNATATSRGRVVHEVLAGLAIGLTFKWEDLDSDLHGYVQSWQKWYEAARPEVLAAEESLYAEHYDFAGTIDLRCRLHGAEWIIDYKTGAVPSWARYQLGGYDALLDDQDDSTVKRKKGCLRLKENGEIAALTEYNAAQYQSDWRSFLALLTAAHIRREING